MPAVFGVVCLIAMIWSAVRYQIVYNRVVELMPPQFQDDLTSRYALPVYALDPSTPLPLQQDYLNSQWAGCVAMLCASLALFSAQNNVFGCFCLAVFVWAVFHTMKSWKTYKQNCNRTASQQAEE
jgi:hypothetical protein